MRFWNGAFANFGRLATGIISLSAMFLNKSVCFSNYILIFYASITVGFSFDNSLLTIPGRPQMATELLQSFLYKITLHCFFKSISLTY